MRALRRACRAFDVRLSEAEAAAMMAAVDHDGGGTVDEEEYARIMRLSPWF